MINIQLILKFNLDVPLELHMLSRLTLPLPNQTVLDGFSVKYIKQFKELSFYRGLKRGREHFGISALILLQCNALASLLQKNTSKKLQCLKLSTFKEYKALEMSRTFTQEKSVPQHSIFLLFHLPPSPPQHQFRMRHNF